MKPEQNMTVADVATMFNEVLPLHSDQLLIFSQLLDSVAYCEKLGSAAWSVTLLKSGFRLNVGRVEVLTCKFTHFPGLEVGYDRNSTMSEIRILLAGAECLSKGEALDENGSIEEMSYKSVGDQHWCYTTMFQSSTATEADPRQAVVADQLARLREDHHHFLKLACTTSSGKLRQKSNFSQHHCESLYAYARTIVDAAPVPLLTTQDAGDAALWDAVRESLADSAASRAARLAAATTIPERYQTSSTAFRRNPDVIAEVLLRAAGRCEACHKPAPFVRATDGTPYIEVHHTLPLSKGGADTVANAVGLCPNCHRAAHFA
jgi:hypothetical protein